MNNMLHGRGRNGEKNGNERPVFPNASNVVQYSKNGRSGKDIPMN
jgi:hypothetical protein